MSSNIAMPCGIWISWVKLQKRDIVVLHPSLMSANMQRTKSQHAGIDCIDSVNGYGVYTIYAIGL